MSVRERFHAACRAQWETDPRSPMDFDLSGDEMAQLSDETLGGLPSYILWTEALVDRYTASPQTFWRDIKANVRIEKIINPITGDCLPIEKVADGYRITIPAGAV